MNYVKQIKMFWRLHEENSFTPTDVTLYFYLLEVCNNCRWKNPFKRNNAKIGADLGMSYNTVKAARNRLQQSGLLQFKSQNGSPNVVYTLSNFDEVTSEVSSEVGDEVTYEVRTRSATTKDKLNKTKQNKKKEGTAPPENSQCAAGENPEPSPPVPRPPLSTAGDDEKEMALLGEIALSEMAMAVRAPLREFTDFAAKWWGKKKAAGDTAYSVSRMKTWIMADWEKRPTKTEKNNTLEAKAQQAERLGANQGSDGYDY